MKMKYTLVNKNLLIPTIETNDNLELLVQKMFEITHNMNISYCEQIYIVNKFSIYFVKNNVLYNIKNGKITELENYVYLNDYLNKMKTFLNEEKQINNDDFTDEDNSINKIGEMKIVFNEKKNNNVIVLDDNINKKNIIEHEIKEKTQEEIELINLIEETMILYQQEAQRKKELEKQLKNLDDNTKLLKKRQNEKIITNFSKLKNDYMTFKKIKSKKNKNIEFEIPTLFFLKYDYFTKIIDKEEIILEKIHEIDIDEFLNKNETLSNEIIELVKQYENDSKKLNVKFDHSWEDLELETEPSEKNNSMLGKF